MMPVPAPMSTTVAPGVTAARSAAAYASMRSRSLIMSPYAARLYMNAGLRHVADDIGAEAGKARHIVRRPRPVHRDAGRQTGEPAELGGTHPGVGEVARVRVGGERDEPRGRRQQFDGRTLGVADAGGEDEDGAERQRPRLEAIPGTGGVEKALVPRRRESRQCFLGPIERPHRLRPQTDP